MDVSTVQVKNKLELSEDYLDMVDFEECISSSQINKIKCGQCGVMCFSNEEYMLHLIDHAERLFKCNLCKVSYNQPRDLTHHMHSHAVLRNRINRRHHQINFHLAKKKYQCKLCGEKCLCRQTEDEEVVENHHTESNGAAQSTETDPSESVCEICYANCCAEGLEVHMSTHDVKPFKCECFMMFFSESEYKKHLKDDCEVVKSGLKVTEDFKMENDVKEELEVSFVGVKEEYEHDCEAVESSSVVAEELRANNVPAMEELEVWGQADKTKQLKRNQRPPSNCPYCNKSYTREHYLRAHIKQHTEQSTPLKCEICDMVTVFKRKQSLRRHMLIHQRDRKMYSCDVCDKVFKVYNSVRVHKKNKHPRECFQCELCGEKLQHELENHLCRHEKEAELVENHRMELTDVTESTETDRSRSVCEICHADCSEEGLEVHISTHNVKPFKCKCLMVFFSESEYKKHLKDNCEVTKSALELVQDFKIETDVKEELKIDFEDIKEEFDS